MINLLPLSQKEQYVYARRNTVLRRWAMALVAGLMGVGLVTFMGLLYMQHSITDYQQQVSQTEQLLQTQKLADVQKQSADITTSLKLVVKVLSREILFSQLLKQIGSVIPANTVLTDLSISDVSGAIEITAITADYTSATQLQVNLEDPTNKIFSKADVQNITCAATATDPQYPCTVRIRALFATDNPYLFINNGGRAR